MLCRRGPSCKNPVSRQWAETSALELSFGPPHVIGGAENQVWHRDAIDLMYDWLRCADLRGFPLSGAAPEGDPG
jgi:hypothetical protein